MILNTKKEKEEPSIQQDVVSPAQQPHHRQQWCNAQVDTKFLSSYHMEVSDETCNNILFRHWSHENLPCLSHPCFFFFFATFSRISPSSVSSLDAPSPFLTIFVFFVFCRIPNHDAPLWSPLTFVLHDSAVGPLLKLWCSNRPSSNVCCCSWLVFRFRVRSPLQRSTSCFT